LPWTCSICGKTYMRPNATRREVLNAWWKHMKKDHPVLYAKKKKAAIRKALATKRKRGIIGKHKKGRK